MQIVWHVILKAAMPEIFTGMRIGIGVGWTTLVAAEMVAADRGLGFMVLNAAQFLDSATVIMGILVIGAFAFGFDLLLRWLHVIVAIAWIGSSFYFVFLDNNLLAPTATPAWRARPPPNAAAPSTSSSRATGSFRVQ